MLKEAYEAGVAAALEKLGGEEKEKELTPSEKAKETRRKRAPFSLGGAAVGGVTGYSAGKALRNAALSRGVHLLERVKHPAAQAAILTGAGITPLIGGLGGINAGLSLGGKLGKKVVPGYGKS